MQKPSGGLFFQTSLMAPLEYPPPETVVYRQMFFKIGVHKIFKNFTGKHLCWSLFLTNFIKNTLQLNTSFFLVKFSNFL